MDTASDIDLLVVGTANIKEINSIIMNIQKKIDREINVVVMSTKEFKEKKAQNEEFLKNVLQDNIKIK